MAATTLHSFLIKLGFDIAGLQAGGAAGRSELTALARAAQQAAAAAAPASAAFNAIGTAGSAAAKGLSPLVTSMNEVSASSGILLRNQGQAAMAMKEAQAAAGPLVTVEQALVQATRDAAAAAGPLVSAEEASAAAMRSATAAAGSLVSAEEMAAAAMRQAQAAAGPLAAGIQGANGAMAAGVPAANLAGAGFRAAGAAAGGAAGGFQAAGAAAGGAAGGIGAAGAAAGGAAGGMGGIPGPALKAAQAMKQVAVAADVVSARSTFMNRVLSMAFAFSGGVAVTTLFGFLANAVLGFNSRLEQARIAFETLLGSQGAADKFIAKMEQFANLTPFNFQGVVEGAQRLMAMGFAADQVIPTLTAVGDAVAALGGTTEKLDRITIALGQMSTAGRVNSQDMRQLTEAGIPAWQMLAEGIGKTVAQTRKLAEQGLIPANQALNIIINSMEERFGGMMARQARTAQGAFSTIRDIMLQTVSSAVEPLFNAMSAGLVGIADFLMNGGGALIAPAIQAIGVALAVALIPRLYGVAIAAAAASAGIGSLEIPILPLIVALTVLGTAWQENIGGMRTALGPIVGALANAAGAALSLVQSTGLLTPAVIVLAAAITTKLVVGAIAAGIALVADTLAARGLTMALSTLTPAAAGAGGGLLGLSVGAGALATTVGALVLPITAIVIAITLLAMNFDRVAQGARVFQIGLLGIQKGIADLAYQLTGQDMFKNLSDGFQRSIDAIKKDMASAEADINRKQADLDAVNKPAATEPYKLDFGSITTGLEETKKMVDRFGTTFQSVVEAAKVAGASAMSEMAKSIQATANAPVDAFKAAMDISKTAIGTQAEIARDVGILQSKELAAGLRSQIPEVAAAWVAVQKAAVENLDRNTGGAFSAGTGQGLAFRQGLAKALAADAPNFGGKGRATAELKEYADFSKVWATIRPTTAGATAALATMRTEIAAGASTASSAADAYLNKFGSSLEAIGKAAETQGAAFMAQYAQGITQNADAPLNALKDLLNLQKTTLSNKAAESRDLGILISKQVSDGLADSRPGVVAQAITTAKFLVDSLNAASGGAYAAGYNAIIALANGMISPGAFQALNKAAAAARFMLALASGQDYTEALSQYRAAVNLVVPSFAAARDAAADFYKGLATGAAGADTGLKTLAADAKDKLKDAFAQIKSAARSMFDELHDRNLKAIDDARDLANATRQGKVDQARDALSAKRNNERLFQMQRAVAMAKTAEERSSAMIDLADFQAELEIDAQQKIVDAQNKAEDEKAAIAKKAENARYTKQVADFNRELALLQRYMLRHPEEWSRMQAKILALLAAHGVKYIDAGKLLGEKFSTGLKKAVGDAEAAARVLAGAAAAAFNAKFKKDTHLPGGATSGAVTSPPTTPGGGKIPQLQTGMFKVLEDNLLAYLDKDEMVVPNGLAGMLRVIAKGQISSGSRPTFGASSATAPIASASFGAQRSIGSAIREDSGGGTIIVMVGNEKLAEITDRGIHVQGTIYAKPVVHNGSTR